jgi:hypothetical protein
MNEAESQPWYRLCCSAVVELNIQRLLQRVDAAEAAIHGRLLDLRHDHEERQRTEDAERTLAFLRRETMRLYADQLL